MGQQSGLLWQVAFYQVGPFSQINVDGFSGKYNNAEIPSDSRMATDKTAKAMVWSQFFGSLADSFPIQANFIGRKKEETKQALQNLEKLAKETGCTQSQLALAWTIVNGDTSTCLLGLYLTFAFVTDG